MITGVVFILIFVAIEVFDKLFGDDLNPHVYIVIMLIALISILALERCAEQNKFTNSDSQEMSTNCLQLLGRSFHKKIL